jgi:hypothetical protein
MGKIKLEQLRDIPENTILGLNDGGGSGSVREIVVGDGLLLSADTLSVVGPLAPSFGSEVDILAWATTTGATPTNLLIDTTRILISSGETMSVVVNISAVISGGTKCLNFVRKVAIKNVGGTTSLVGTVSEVGVDVSDDGAYLVDITTDNTNDALDILVTGKSGETIKWLASIKGIKIIF